MGSRVKVLKNRNLPLRHLPCLPRQFGFWKKLVESEILFGETRRQGSYRGMSFYLSGEESQQPNRICPACFELQLLTFCGFNEESRVTRRRDFLEFLTFLRFTSIFERFSDFLFGLCSMFAQFRKSKVTFEEQNLNIYSILVLILLVTPL